MPGVVQRRAHQGVHAGVQADAAHAVLLHHLGGMGQQHAGFGHQVAPRLDRQAERRVQRLDLGQALGPGIQVERFVFITVGNRQNTADVDGLHAADAAGETGQLIAHQAPVLRGLHAAAQVRVQADHAAAQLGGRTHEFVDAGDRQAELGVLAAGPASAAVLPRCRR
ncbi:hypothetical protein G6F50_015808 [Rhizopus delemar]|uniref:Uncharacterized protein n=1 Tax=Rhizopus delemar TaxID=936053 RepID=A0A9P6XWS4_9FUNG|nr:hypothetical protein G6F50_015808 [Rhizopus delemar]